MDTLKSSEVVKPMSLIATFAGLSVLYFLGQLIYRVYFHPLHHIPGPWINSISRIPYARHLLKGTTAENVMRLHEKYGEVVRLSPNEVSFISGETAWQDIYGFRTGKMKGHATMLKDPAWYIPPAQGSHIIVADDEDHSRFRRTLAHAFSEKALARQEVLIQQYVDLLVNQLKEVISSEKTQDLGKWYNWTTFDIVADLIFGEPFGCLRDIQTHKYIPGILNSLASFRFNYVMYYYPFVKYLRGLIINQKTLEGRRELYGWMKTQTEKRMAMETQRPDFMTEILKHNGEKGAELTALEIANNNVVFMSAGSETTASLLSGTTFLLLQNPSCLQKLKDEVRGRWKNYDDITMDEVSKAPYLLAVLNEAMRYFPPAPAGFQRRVPKGGEVVSGYYVPEGTALAVSQFPLGRSERNFKDANSFIPERWMDDPRFTDDKRDTVQPFNFGPRNCLGKNLAYAEMRLILAKMIWAFDLELDPKCTHWMDECKVFTVWSKPPLWVRMTARE